MTSSTSSLREKRLIKFLKERNLYQRYRRDEKVKESGARTYKVNTSVDGEKKQFLLYKNKKNNKTYIVDRNTYKYQGSSKKPIPYVRQNIGKERLVQRKERKGFEGIRRTIVKREIRTNIVRREHMTNVTREYRKNTLTTKVGQTELKIEWTGYNNQTQTTMGTSASPRHLNIKSEREASFNEAYRSARRDLKFSPKSEIIQIQYIYYYPKKK